MHIQVGFRRHFNDVQGCRVFGKSIKGLKGRAYLE